MQISKLNESIQMLKDSLGSSLIAADIWLVSDGVSIAGYNQQPGVTAAINKITIDLNTMLKSSNLKGLGKYYFLDLMGGNKALIVPLNEYEWGIIVDKNVQIGFLLHVVLPKLLDKFEEAVVD